MTASVLEKKRSKRTKGSTERFLFFNWTIINSLQIFEVILSLKLQTDEQFLYN